MSKVNLGISFLFVPFMCMRAQSQGLQPPVKNSSVRFFLVWSKRKKQFEKTIRKRLVQIYRF